MALLDLSTLHTEGVNPRTTEIDSVSTEDLCRLINEEDSLIGPAVAKCIPVIADAIGAVAPRVQRGGRLIYVGAGTSGRLGVIDASEIPPTFSAPHGQFIALMAGGDAAMRSAQEGAEDNFDAAEQDLAPLVLDPDIDSLIAIAASGRTPYVLGALSYAKELGCITIGLACTDPSNMSGSAGLVDYMIHPITGPEVVTGSTRMKAGTATKLVLNMLSTGIMIKIGKTYGNMMVDLQASNLKLKHRSKTIIRKVSGPLCPSTDEKIDRLLAACDGSVKLSLATLFLGTDPEDAGRHLDIVGGHLSMLLTDAATRKVTTNHQTAHQNGDAAGKQSLTGEGNHPLVLYVDGGGSKCAAAIVTSSGQIGEGEAGPCNVTDLGVKASVASIKLAAQRALDSLHGSYPEIPQLDLDSVQFAAIWIGLAGHDRPQVAAKLRPALSSVFKVCDSRMLRVSNDIDVLATAASTGVDEVPESAIVLIAGTGSVCMRYTRDQKSETDEYIRNGRTGGWGHLLGDDGGGFDLGRQAIRLALFALDELQSAHPAPSPQELADAVEKLPPLPRTVLQHLQLPGTTVYDPLGSLLTSDAGLDGNNTLKADSKARIAQVARLVLDLAEKTSQQADVKSPAIHYQVEHNLSTQAILDNGVSGLIRTLKTLLPDQSVAARSALVLGGGLLTGETATYQTALLSELERLGIRFRDVRVIKQPASLGARVLARKHFGLDAAADI